MALEDLADGAALWPRPPRVLAAQDLKQLLGSPARVMLSSFENRFDQLGGRAVGRARGSARSLTEAAGPFLYLAIDPLVAGLATDAIAVAQFHYREGSVQHIGDELRLLVHRRRFAPGHRAPP